MSFGLVQQNNSANQLGLSTSAAFGSNVTANNSLLVATFVMSGPPTSGSGHGSISTVVDNVSGDSYGASPVYIINGAANQPEVSLWVANKAKGGATTVTATWTGSGNPGISLLIFEISGGQLVLNQKNSAFTGAANPSAGSITPANGDFCIAAVCNNAGTNGYSAGSGWTNSALAAGAAAAEYQLSNGSAITGNFVNSAAVSYSVLVASFSAQAAGGSGKNLEREFGPDKVITHILNGRILWTGVGLPHIK